MSRARTSLAAILVVLACLLLPVAVASSWMKAVVTDPDDYVATVAPLATNATVQRAAERRLEASAVTAIEGLTGAEVPEVGRALVAATARGIVESPQFAVAWRAANRAAHEQATAVLEGRSAAVTTEDGRVSIELGTVLNTILAQLDERGLIPGDRVPQVSASFPVVRESHLGKAQDAYAVLDAAGFWLPVLWLLLVVMAVAVAPVRRRVLGWLGLGSLVTLVLLLGVLFLARHEVVSSADTSVDAELLRVVWETVTSSLYKIVWVTMAVAAVVIAVRLVAGLFLGRRVS